MGSGWEVSVLVAAVASSQQEAVYVGEGAEEARLMCLAKRIVRIGKIRPLKKLSQT